MDNIIVKTKHRYDYSKPKRVIRDFGTVYIGMAVRVDDAVVSTHNST